MALFSLRTENQMPREATYLFKFAFQEKKFLN